MGRKIISLHESNMKNREIGCDFGVQMIRLYWNIRNLGNPATGWHWSGGPAVQR